MGAYETWHATREMVGEEKDSERKKYLEQVQEMLQPAALLDYLETASHRFYRDPDGWSAEAEPATSEEVRQFLAGLDELRAPSQRELVVLRAEMLSLVDNALARMLKSNWTGDHAYGDALRDAQEVLGSVLEGKPFPKLERFRCPSLTGNNVGAGRLRCELQLPHEGDHRNKDAAGKGVSWTDEQSINPPKNYDEPERCGSKAPYSADFCALPKGHTGRHLTDDAGPLSWPNGTDTNPDPINRPTAEQTNGECGAVYSVDPPREGWTRQVCIRPKQHAGMHRDASGGRWRRLPTALTESPEGGV